LHLDRFFSAYNWAMSPKPKKVKETFNALGVTGGAPKFKQQAKSTRKPTSWERKALKAAKAQEVADSATISKIDKVQLSAPSRQALKHHQGAKTDGKRQQRPAEPSSSSSSSSADNSSDESSSSDDQSDPQPKSKGSSSKGASKNKKLKKEKVVSITFEHFPVEERDFHGISVSVAHLVFTCITKHSFLKAHCRDCYPVFWGGLNITLGTLPMCASQSVIR